MNSLAPYFPDALLFNLAADPSLNITITKVRATSETIAAPPIPDRGVNLKGVAASTGVPIMRPFDFIQPGREGKQGVVVGVVRLGRVVPV